MLPIDFEFFKVNKRYPTLVCAAFNGKSYWLLDDSDTNKLIADLQVSKQLLAYYAIAEARCLEALGFNPLHFEWVDLYVEFKMLQNSNNKYAYGSYLDENGLKKFSTPKDLEAEIEDENNAKVPSNLINAVYKTTNKIISSDQKNKMRDIILSGDTDLITAHKQEIMDYCLSDTLYLPDLWAKIQSEYYRMGLRNYHKNVYDRGRYAAATSLCEVTGIPINKPLLDTIIQKTPEILQESKDAVNELSQLKIGRKIFLPEIVREPKVYKNGKVHHYKPEPPRKDTKAVQDVISSLTVTDWPLTEGGTYKTDKETLENYRYIPIIEELYKYNKTEASLKWFNNDNSNGFFDAYDFDNHVVRPFYGIFGTQTGRNAAKAKTYPLAMSSWLRAIIQPKQGQVIIGADFSQQEVAVAAWLSRDQNLINAYNSGDVYLEFAKQANLVPPTATKKTHKAERDLCKSTVLGLQYGMGANKLQHKLSFDSKSDVSMERTLELIQAHKTVYAKYWKWVFEQSNKYKDRIPLITNDGWVLWTDNPIITSVRNFPVQANSASITRRALVLAWEAGLVVMCSLHDALYVISNNPSTDEAIMKKIMRQATEDILGKGCIEIRIDTKIVTHDEIWVEEKGAQEWDKIKKHLF